MVVPEADILHTLYQEASTRRHTADRKQACRQILDLRSDVFASNIRQLSLLITPVQGLFPTAPLALFRQTY